ncbi:invasion associated locus B family protein [Hoeflea prorocentri]|nr:invasion associated locus B family protein [Hoeflea prorocentri]MCY6379423.1 invasion associated locus B family protein [Hoeflea prorocentri]
MRAGSLLIEAAQPQGSMPDADVRVFKDWRVVCADRRPQDDAHAIRACTIRPYPDPFTERGGVISLVGRVVTTPTSREPLTLFVLKTRQGFLIPNGVELRIDQKKTHLLAYHSCDRGACTVPFAMTGALREAFEKGGQAQISVSTKQASKTHVTFSLLGFSAAIKAFEDSTR